MKKIVGVLKPFELNQKFYVYEDGEKIEDFQCPLGEVSNNILGMAHKYNIFNIDLTGPKQFSKGIKKNLEEKILLENNLNDFKINII